MKKIQSIFNRLIKKPSADRESLLNSREAREAIQKKNETMYLLIDIFRCMQINR